MILCDWEITELALKRDMIAPFVCRQEGEGVISYGLSSFGYDIRVAGEYRVTKVPYTGQGARLTVFDPKCFDTAKMAFDEVLTDDACIIPPHGFALARSVETFRIPINVLGLCVGKSTYARAGVIVNITPLEPGWQGELTIEISNTTPYPVAIHSNEGIAQVMFFQGAKPDINYRNRNGKYMNQLGIVFPKV